MYISHTEIPEIFKHGRFLRTFLYTRESKIKIKNKHLCFREHLAWTPLSHFLHIGLDLW